MKRILKPEILQKLRKNEQLQLRIATALQRRFSTVKRWIRENDEFLTSPAVLSIILEEYKAPESEIVDEVELEKEKAVA